MGSESSPFQILISSFSQPFPLVTWPLGLIQINPDDRVPVVAILSEHDFRNDWILGGILPDYLRPQVTHKIYKIWYVTPQLQYFYPFLRVDRLGQAIPLLPTKELSKGHISYTIELNVGWFSIFACIQILEIAKYIYTYIIILVFNYIFLTSIFPWVLSHGFFPIRLAEAIFSFVPQGASSAHLVLGQVPHYAVKPGTLVWSDAEALHGGAHAVLGRTG